MVVGLESFREAFKDYQNNYTIIGGTACDILMTQANLDFRITKDLDMILIIENDFEEFGRVFWAYIKEGEYKCGWKNDDNQHFYRFTEPKNKKYPKMIELFSKDPGYCLHKPDTLITPIHISDNVKSLSAIILNDNYYELMMGGRVIVNGIGVLEAPHIIPFKMKAWLDLKELKKAGGHVNSVDFKKHKNDVFRLLNLLSPNEKVSVCYEISY